MKNTPTVGQILTNLDDLGQLWTVQAIALHWDVMDVAVIMAKTDETSWITAEYDIRRDSYGNHQYWTNSEEATQSWCSQAFGM
jgi:hypothetical protein